MFPLVTTVPSGLGLTLEQLGSATLAEIQAMQAFTARPEQFVLQIRKLQATLAELTLLDVFKKNLAILFYHFDTGTIFTLKRMGIHKIPIFGICQQLYKQMNPQSEKQITQRTQRARIMRVLQDQSVGFVKKPEIVTLVAQLISIARQIDPAVKGFVC